ncbi:MAG: DUF1501 domain-containing protein [Planctomycetota bacterium]
MSNEMSRREALRLGLYGLAASGMTLLPRQARAVPLLMGSPNGSPVGRKALGPRKVLLIFLRGGNDGINTLVPFGDRPYIHPLIRPTIQITNPQNINGFCGLHPAMDAFTPAGRSSLALIHRVGYEDSSLSHFTGQYYWETGQVASLDAQDGWVAKAAVHGLPQPGVSAAGCPEFATASVATKLQAAFGSPTPANVQPNVPFIGDEAGNSPDDAYSLDAGTTDPELLAAIEKFRGVQAATGPGLLDHYQNAALPSQWDALARSYGEAMINTECEVANTVLAPYTSAGTQTYPEGGVQGLPAENWVTPFGNAVRDAVRLLKLTSCVVAGVEVGTWDHHSDQGGEVGRHADKLRALSQAMQAAFEDLGNDVVNPTETLIMVMSEFGRTTRENSSGGTDHARASVMMAMGPTARGGVYNCDPTTWFQGAPADPVTGRPTWFSPNLPASDPLAKYIFPLTDFRIVYYEALARHLGITDLDVLEQIIPGIKAKVEEHQQGVPTADPLFAEIGYLL